MRREIFVWVRGKTAWDRRRKSAQRDLCGQSRMSPIDRHEFVWKDHMLFLLIELEAIMGSLRYHGL